MELREFLKFIKWRVREEKDPYKIKAYSDIRRWFFEVNGNQAALVEVLERGAATGRSLSTDEEEIKALQGCYVYMKDVLSGQAQVYIPNEDQGTTQFTLW